MIKTVATFHKPTSPGITSAIGTSLTASSDPSHSSGSSHPKRDSPASPPDPKEARELLTDLKVTSRSYVVGPVRLELWCLGIFHGRDSLLRPIAL